jgi:uncharacterized protein (DUF1810 family)
VTDADLIHFVNAQSDVYDQVTEELTEGRKRTHWMWFIFPQLTGLGHSGMARRYAIRDLDHARRYLADLLLGRRLCHDLRLMMSHKGKSALNILGIAFGRTPTKIRPPSRGGSGKRLNTAGTTLMIKAFFKFAANQDAMVIGR